MTMDPFEEMLQNRDKAGALRSSVSFGVTQNPDVYAKAYKLAARSGAKPQAVLENGTAFENAGKLKEFDFDGFIKNTPRLASWATVPDNSAQAHDDFPVLQHLEEIASQVLQIPQRAMGGLISSLGGSQRVLGSLAEQAGKPNSSLMSKIVGYGLLPGAAINPEVGTAMRQSGEDVQRYYEPLFTDSALQAETRSGKVTGFVGGIGGAFGKALLTGPAAPLLFGLEAFGAKGGQALDTGATPNQAMVEATGSATLNTALGILPGGKQGQSLARAAATRVGRGVVLGAGVTVGENLLTRIHDAKVPLTQGMAENIVNFLGMEAAGAYHEHLNRMASASAESKLRARAPEKFKEVVAEITKDSPVENILVPAEAFQRYFQSQGMDPAKVAEASGAKNYAEALAAGTDVVIPSADYLTHLAAEHHQGLAQDIRLKSSELTPRELEAYKQEAVKVETEIKDQGAEAIKDAQDPAFQAIKEETLRQLVAAGDDPSVAETRATIHAQAMKTMAERSGIDPITLHEAYNLRITRPTPGEFGTVTDRAVGRMAEPSMDAVLWQTSDLAARGEKPTLKDVGVGNEQAPIQSDRTRSREVSGPDEGTLQRDMRPTWDASTRTWRGSDFLGAEPGRWQGKLTELAPDPTLQDYQRRNIPVVNVNGVEIAGGPRPPYFSFHGNAEATGAPGYSKGQRGKAGDGIYVARDHADAGIYGGKNGQIHAIYADTSKMVSFDGRSSRLYTPQELAAIGLEYNKPLRGDQVLKELVNALKSPENPYGGGGTMSEHLRALGFNGVAFDLGADGKPAWNLFDPRVIKRFTDATTWSPEEIARRQAFDPEPLGAGGRQIEDNPTYYQTAYHGSPYRFDKFSLDHMGKGEGNQAYGWGLYFAGDKSTAEWYRKTLSDGSNQRSYEYKGETFQPGTPEWKAIGTIKNDGKRSAVKLFREILEDAKAGKDYTKENGVEFYKKMLDIAEAHTAKDKIKELQGQTYQVEIPDEGSYLLWDKHFDEQPQHIQKALFNVGDSENGRPLTSGTGAQIYDQVQFAMRMGEIPGDGSKEAASKFLNSLGISGIKYLDGSSRSAGEGSFNYVIFDDKAVQTLKTYYQEGPKGFDFGSKEWNDYYLGRNKDGAKSISDRAKRARAAYEKALTKGGDKAELDRRASELQAAVDADAAAFANFDAEVKALQAGDVYTEGGEKKGFIQFGNDRKIQIGFLEQADLSTFTHETGHMYVEILHDLAARPQAPEQVKADLAKIRKFVGAEGDAPLTVEQHEKLARANEAYLMEGKAPSDSMRGVFQRVKFWMMNVYRNISGLGVKLNDDVRGVFDRIYASDAEIERARQDIGSDRAIFAKPEDMGVTPAEFDIYVKAKAKEIAMAKEALASRMMRELSRERTAWWKEESAKVREEVAAEVDGDAVYVAFKSLADGKLPDGTPIKLSKAALIEEFGEAVVKELPRSFQRLYSREGGMDATTAAEFLGIRSGEALVEALKGMEPRKERIERLTQERMKAKHGDLTAPAAIADAAMEALHSDQRGEVLASELRAIRDQQRKMKPAMDLAKSQAKEEVKAVKAEGQAALKDAQAQAKTEEFWRRGVVAEVPPLDTFKKAAVELIEAQQTKDLDPYRYLQGQRKASREAFDALAKGDYAAAGDAKQKELLNHFLFREATKGKEEVEAAYDYARKFGKTSTRQRIGKAQGGYLEQIDGLLERFQFVAEAKRDILARQESLAEFAYREATNGEEIAIDPALFVDRPKNYRELTLPELRAVKDALRNIETVARRQLEFIQDGKRVVFEDAVAEMDASARASATRIKPLEVDPLTKGVADKTKDWFLHKDAMLLKLEQMVEWLDGGDINGPWAKYLFEPIAKAQAAEYALQEKVTAKMADAMEQMPKEQRLKLLDTFDIPGIGTVTRKWILSLAFNMGNEENQTKMLKGHGWADPKGMEAVGKALDKLNRADWEFVQRTWDTINELWPQIADLQQRMTGIVPEKVEARPFTVTLADGSTMGMQGGYYPLMYDSARSTQGAMQQTGELAGLFEQGYARATTNKGHTKERTAFSAPLVLDFEQVLTNHTAKVIKDLTHREAVLAVNKLITNQTVRTAIQETLGPAYEAQFLPWLRGVVNDRNASASQGLGDFNRTMMTMRSNVAAATLGFKVTSVMVQATDLVRAWDRVPGVELASAFLDFVRHPQQVTEQVRGLSEEMRFRADNIDRDMRAALQNLQGKTGAYKEVQEFAFHGLGMADAITSVTTWLGAYRTELAKGTPEEQAVRQADRTVRLLLQAGNPKDLPAIQRQDGLAKFVTMFMGDASATYGLLRDASHQFRGGGSAPKFASRVVFGVLLTAILGDLIKQRGPALTADDPDKAKKLAKWAVTKSLLAAPATVPLLRDVANVIDNGMDYRFTPAASGLQKAGKLFITTGKVLDGKSEQLPAMAFQAADVFGTLGGIPGTAQILTSGKYLYNVHTGKENPENAWELVKNTVMGKNPQEKKR